MQTDLLDALKIHMYIRTTVILKSHLTATWSSWSGMLTPKTLKMFLPPTQTLSAARLRARAAGESPSMWREKERTIFTDQSNRSAELSNLLLLSNAFGSLAAVGSDSASKNISASSSFVS